MTTTAMQYLMISRRDEDGTAFWCERGFWTTNPDDAQRFTDDAQAQAEARRLAAAEIDDGMYAIRVRPAPRWRTTAAQVAECIAEWIDGVRVLSHRDAESHHEITVRAADERTARRAITDAIVGAFGDWARVWQGATLVSVATISDRPLDACERWTYSAIITDRRDAR